MKKRMAIAGAVLVIILAAAVFLLLGIDDGNTTGEVIIYHTNDTHGYLDGDGESVIGIDVVAGLKDSTPGSILVDAGDATQGLPLATMTKGADVIELMNLAGYDLMTPGNHEFDFGTEQFLSNVALADFPILSANLYRDGQLLLDGVQEDGGCHTILERDGVRVGFFGLTTTQTASATNPAMITGLEWEDEIETAKKEIDELEEADADVIVGICHMGDGDASCTSTELAEALTGEYQDKLDIIIDGHSHTVENEEVNGVLIVQTGSGMTGVGKLTVSVDDGAVTATEELLTYENMPEVTPDAEVADKLAQIQEGQAEMLETKVGSTETTLWAGQIGAVAITRLVETNYGDFVADAFREAGEAFMQITGGEDAELPVIAVENGGGIRAGAANGDITSGDLISALPFSNTLYLKIVTPKILYTVMEVSGSTLDGQDKETGMLLQETNFGGFLQVSGFTVVFDPDKGEGERVASITLDGQTEPLDPEDDTTQIVLVSNNYIMSGGNDYTMLGELPKYGEAGGELETVQDYLDRCMGNGEMHAYAGTQNRIQMRSEGYAPKDYTASVLITDEAGEILANQALSYRVDGGERLNGTTDENGILQITLPDGAHGVRLADTQQEIYLDNYCGFGIIVDEYREQPTLTFLPDGSCDPIAE